MKEIDSRPEEDAQSGEDIDAEIGSTATMVCIYVTASALTLAALITRAGNPADPSMAQIFTGMFAFIGFPSFTFMAARNTLKYIRLLHDRSRSAGNHRGV